MLEEWGAKTFSESPLGELESRKGEEERTEAMAPGREKPGLDASRVSQEQGRARETGRVEIKGKEEESCQGSLVPGREPRSQMVPSKVPVDPWDKRSQH